METQEDKIRERQVLRYTGMIRDDLEQIYNSVSILRDNLTPVLKEDLLSSDSNKEEEEEKLVPFACDLRDFHRRMKNILSTINYMNEALEL